MTQTETNQIEFTRINNDINGNPRYVCHFLAFVNNNDRVKLDEPKFDKYGVPVKKADIFGITSLYEIALRKSRQLGGKKFHNKQYGGGIVFQMYSGQQDEMSSKIREIANQ